MGWKARTPRQWFARAGVALRAVFGRRAIRDRAVLPVRQRAARHHQGWPAGFGGRLGSATGWGRAVAAIPEFRRHFLYLPDSARSQGPKGHGGPDRTAPAFLYRPHRNRADRGAGADPQLVADDVLLRVQGAGR